MPVVGEAHHNYGEYLKFRGVLKLARRIVLKMNQHHTSFNFACERQQRDTPEVLATNVATWKYIHHIQ